MARHLLSNNSFRRGVFATIYLCLLGNAGILLFQFKMRPPIAWADSAVHVGLLAFAAVSLSYMLAYYRPSQRKYSFLIACSAVQTFIWSCLSAWLLGKIFPSEIDYQNWLRVAAPIFDAFGFLIMMGMGIISLLTYDMADKQDELARKETAERLAREAELYKLRQQLQPHFLFNSLNSISALISLRPPQAREMVLKLSDFLRGTLKREDQQWISLPDELQYLQWYLDIEKVRFGHRLTTNVSASEEAEALKIPPMLLQPVMENAIKYGLYDTTDAIEINLIAWMKDNMLYIQVQNPFDASSAPPQSGTGFGLTSIKRRLYLLFGRHDLLETSAKENIYTTLIKVPQLYDKSNPD
jgi:two-component system, LytTR family, sensor kinase